MANTEFICPHCKGQISATIIPHKAQQNRAAPAGVFESATQFIDTLPANESPAGVVIEDIKRHSFWASDAVNNFLYGLFAGCVVYAYSWYYDVGNGAIIAGVILAPLIIFPLLKLYWYRPTGNRSPGATERTIKLNIETTQGNTTYLDGITDRRVIDNLESLGNAFVRHPELATNFSKAAIRRHCKIGGRKYDAIIEEFKRLNYCHIAPNNRTVLSLRAKALLRENATVN